MNDGVLHFILYDKNTSLRKICRKQQGLWDGSTGNHPSVTETLLLGLMCFCFLFVCVRHSPRAENSEEPEGRLARAHCHPCTNVCINACLRGR